MFLAAMAEMEAMLNPAPEPLPEGEGAMCACGHRFTCHGDRAIYGCDGCLPVPGYAGQGGGWAHWRPSEQPCHCEGFATA